jgi:alkylation response protein AidB-like acyl-CoA dehydrogenase
MDFDLTAEQRALQSMVREFTEREIEPVAGKIDIEGKIPGDLCQKLADVGLFGITIPQKYGGTDAGNLSCTLAIEQLARSGTGVWWLVAFHNSIPACIAQFGSDEIKDRYLPLSIRSDIFPSIQFTEEETGSDPDALVTTARPDGDSYVLSGKKRFSTFGARDGYAVVYAKDESGKCSAFVVDKNAPGYTAEKTWELMGGGGIEAADVYLENLRVPEKNLLGNKGDGFSILLTWIATEKIEQCAACVGMAQSALDEAVKYAGSRMTRGRPISSLQGIRWMLAEMYSKLEAARWMTYRAAFLQDQNAENWMTEAAAAKVFVVPATMEVVEMSRRIHGAYGYTREFKIERLYRAIAGSSAIAVSLEINKSIVGAALAK